MQLNSWFRVEEQGIVLYKCVEFEQTGLVSHGFTARMGGVSSPPRDTLNLALHVNDDPDAVVENRRRVASALGCDPRAMTGVEQVHGSVVAIIGNDAVGNGATDFSGVIRGADAMVTDVPGALLSLFFADCVPVFILDPVRKCIGLAHAGWKGTALRIVRETVMAMSDVYGSNLQNCLAAIGPSIGRCCYEVGDDVAAALSEAVGTDNRVLSRGSAGKWRADLKIANWKILRKCGLSEENIAVSQHCTCCNPDEFFSYRRDGETGRMGAFLALRCAGAGS